MNSATTPKLFNDLTAKEARSTQGGCYRRVVYRPCRYYHPSPASASNYGSDQIVNVNVAIDD